MKKILRFAVIIVLCLCVFQIPGARAADLADSLETAGKPGVSAKSAVVIDGGADNIIFEKNARERMPMASTTKIMTALVAAENYDLAKTVEVSPLAVGVEGSSIYLLAGEKLTMEELLYALLLESANDAAAAIAIEVGGSVETFAEMMNEKARELGLTDTNFTNPHGLSDKNHYTTAYDLAVISAAALENETIRQIVGTQKKAISFKNGEGKRYLNNHNKMLRMYDGAIGVKTGFTRASGRCLVSAAEKDGLTLIAVTLNAPDDWRDHAAMLDYGFANYESVNFADAGKYIYRMPVTGGVDEYAILTNSKPLILTLPKNRGEPEVTVETFSRFEYAPIGVGKELGTVTVTVGEHSVSSPLVSAVRVGQAKPEEKSFFDKIKDLFN